jgi:hypothetical protein
MGLGSRVALVGGLLAALLAGCGADPEDPAHLRAHLQQTLSHSSSIDPARVDVRIVHGDVTLQVDGQVSDADALALCRDAADWLYDGTPANDDDDILVVDGRGRLRALSLAARDGCGPPPH